MSVRFDAATDRITYSATSPPNPASGFTLTAWAYVVTNTATNATFARLHASSGGATTVTFATDADGLAGPGYFTGGGSVVATTNMAVGAWRRVAMTCLTTTGHVYVATPTGTTQHVSGTVAGTANPTGITLGGRSASDSSEWLNGRLAYVRLWSRQLTQTEIEAEWASATPVSTTSLFADWPLTVATDLTDHSGNGRNMVAGSTAVTTEADPPLSATYVKTGGAASAAAGVGAETVVSATVYTKTGGAVSAGVGVGARIVVRSKTGGAAGSATGVGARSVTSATVVSKTGGAVVLGVGVGAETVTHPVVVAKSGGSVSVSAAVGSEVVAHPVVVSKTGGAVCVDAGVGGRVLEHQKTGGAVTSGVGVGAETVTHPAVYAKTGGAAGSGTAVGTATVTPASVVTKTGGAVTVATGVGSRVVTGVGSIAKSGGAGTVAVGSGAKSVTSATTYAKSGGAASFAAGIAAKVVITGTVITKTGGAVARGTGSGVRPLVIIKTGGAVAHCVGGSLHITPATPTNWPPVIDGPSAAPLVLVSGPQDAPLILVSPSVEAPLVLVSGPRSTTGSGASELPMMSRRGLSRRSLPAEADEFVIAQFRALRERRRAAKIRRANP